ncbi:hypothetical protein HMPREF9061_01419 [Actinomyces sp. oral taxon 181 str. F0379]|nr:hypothetical protein HMPREF9061_01419 [Actinomyces sp. oral taxon 181 str. F0379]
MFDMLIGWDPIILLSYTRIRTSLFLKGQMRQRTMFLWRKIWILALLLCWKSMECIPLFGLYRQQKNLLFPFLLAVN